MARKKAGVCILFKGVSPRTAAAALALLVFLGVFGVVRRTVGGALRGGATGAAGPGGGVHARAGGGGRGGGDADSAGDGGAAKDGRARHDGDRVEDL